MTIFSLLIVCVLILTILYCRLWEYHPKRERDPNQELYERGFEHGRRGYQRDVDHREAYNDGYSDGLKVRVISEGDIEQKV